MENRREKDERIRVDSLARAPLMYRLHRALGPIAGGLILDFVDLATFGPLGVFGLFIGMAVGWWISSIYRFPPNVRIAWAVMAGLYCMCPFTAPLPLATIISAVARFEEDPSLKERFAEGQAAIHGASPHVGGLARGAADRGEQREVR